MKLITIRVSIGCSSTHCSECGYVTDDAESVEAHSAWCVIFAEVLELDGDEAALRLDVCKEAEYRPETLEG